MVKIHGKGDPAEGQGQADDGFPFRSRFLTEKVDKNHSGGRIEHGDQIGPAVGGLGIHGTVERWEMGNGDEGCQENKGPQMVTK